VRRPFDRVPEGRSLRGSEPPRPAASAARSAAPPGRELGRVASRRAGAPGTGRPLDGGLRTELEGLLGHQLGDVRVHTGEAASRSARAVGALAYTIGDDVVLGSGLGPGDPAGRAVLAHELAHVVQQSPGGGPAASPRDAESEAQAAGRAVAAGRPFAPRLRTPVALARLAPPEDATDVGAWQAYLEEQRLDVAADMITALTVAISAQFVAYRAATEAQRPPLVTGIEAYSRQLAGALDQRAQLLEIRIAELDARAAAGEDVSDALETARGELAEHRADLVRLGRVFSSERGAAFEETYAEDVSGCHCMQAAYKGLATLRTPAESAEIQLQVEANAERAMRRATPVDINHFISVMNVAHAEEAAGPRQRARWSKADRTWTPTLESLIRAPIHPTVPGFYFFGLALAEAYHSVMIGVSTWDDPPRILWCDQYGCGAIPGTLDDFARSQAEGFGIEYGDWDTYIWEVVPPPGAGLITPREEAE